MPYQGLKTFFRQMTHIRKAREQYDTFAQEYPPGHFFNPIPSKEEVLSRQKKIFKKKVKEIPGIPLNATKQLNLLKKLGKYYEEIPFSDYKSNRLIYYFINNYFSYADAVIYYGIIRHFKPKRIIEVGSGFSSAVTLDINNMFFKNKIRCAFIEPFPQRLQALLSDLEKQKFSILEKPVQDVPLSFFKKLEPHDILFIDSSHVSKTGSDVNFLLFEVLPRLKKGVLIHFHDIFYPFEYPQKWIEKGRAWNECYLVRAFLQYNKSFQILLFNTYLALFHQKWFQAHMPLFLKKTNLDWSSIEECSSLWLVKAL